MGLLDGKVAVITGAGRGVGRAEALLFASEGARVVVNDVGCESDGTGASEEPAREVVAEIERSGGQAAASFETVATAEGARRIMDQAVEAFGRVDILVNNAGILVEQSLLELSAEAWDAVVATHLRGSFLCAQEAARRMIEQGDGGRIVNTTGATGLVGTTGQTGTAVAEAGIYGLTRAMAVELQPHRITVNALAPVARTRLTEQQPRLQGLDELTPEHVAPAALLLASELCEQRTGLVLGAAAGRLFSFKVSETGGKYKDGEQPWTAAEIAENWHGIVK